MAGSNSAILEVSGIPPIDAGRRLRYLVTYPHGCIEQITSAAFPQLFLADVMDLDDKTRAATEMNIKTALRKLQSFELSGGGFAYWPGNQQINSWSNSYAGTFLLEAEKKRLRFARRIEVGMAEDSETTGPSMGTFPNKDPGSRMIWNRPIACSPLRLPENLKPVP